MSQPDGDIPGESFISPGGAERLRLMVEAVRDYAIFMLDPAGHITSWNAGAERLKGYCADEIIGRHFSAFYPPEDVAADKPGQQLKLAAARGRWEDEGWRVRNNGTRFWASVVITALQDPDGRLLGYGKVTRDLTERRQAELDLSARERLLSGVLHAATEHAITSTDMNGTLTVFNRGAERMLGYRADEVVGLHTPLLFHDPDEVAAREDELGIARGFELFDTAAREPRPDAGEWTYVRKDGSRLRVHLTVSTVMNEDGQPCGYIGIAADLTERDRGETALRAASDQAAIMEKAFTGAPGGVALIGLDRRFVRVNAALCEILGRQEDEIVGLTSDAFTHPDDLALTAEGYLDIETGAAPRVRMEKRYLKPDGSVVWAVTDASPVGLCDGGPSHIVAHVHDVTARHEAEERSRAAEEQFRRAFEDAPIGMMMLGLDSRYMQVNDAFCAMVGRSREALLSRTRQSITHPDDVPHDEEAVRSLLDGSAKSRMWEKRFIHAAGHPVWVSISVTAIRARDGQPTHLIAQALDITARRRYQSELQHMADHDPLTGLPNRRSFERELNHHLVRLKGSGPRGAVLMIDLDNFKSYNDTRGHSAGDELIVRIGRALHSRLRESDVLARLGGDEFAALLPEADRDGAEAVARSMLRVVCDGTPSPVQGGKYVTASIGIALFSDGDALAGHEVLVNADLAMYEAKANGRNGFVRYRATEHTHFPSQRPMIRGRHIYAARTDG